jgi:translation initiation factor IF-3
MISGLTCVRWRPWGTVVNQDSRRRPIAEQTFRVNGQIRARSIRVVDDEGGQVGILDLPKAIEMARERGLDLVEVSPNATPPVCRIMDFGKFKYEQKKKSQEARKKQVVTTIKEIKVRPQTDKHDLEVKVRAVRRFLEEGDKVKFNVFFRGREYAHPELGEKVLRSILEAVKEQAKLEVPPQMDGRRMIMVIAPELTAKPKPAAAKAAPAADAAKPAAKPAAAKKPAAKTKVAAAAEDGAEAPVKKKKAPADGDAEAPAAEAN